MAKSIFFDLDGTLTDSGEGIINCAAVTLEHFGIPVPSREEIRVIVGPPLRESFLKFGVSADRLPEAISIYRSRYNTIGKFENFPYPGIPELLAKLKAQGCKLYVATSKPETTSVEILEHFGLASFFEIIAGAAADGLRDTKSQVIAYLLEQTGDLDEIIMVGDTVFDVIGAAAHNIPTIGVSWGYGEAEDLRSAGAAAIAHSTDELFTLLTQ